MEIKYGGQLKEGDFLIISNGNYISFGWYAGQGRGTLQYWWLNQPHHSFEQYQKWLNTPEEERKNLYFNKRYAKGFTRNCLGKTYIYGSSIQSRVVKVSNPEEFLPLSSNYSTTLEEYQKSKEVLINLNIIKQ